VLRKAGRRLREGRGPAVATHSPAAPLSGYRGTPKEGQPPPLPAKQTGSQHDGAVRRDVQHRKG